MGCLLAAAGAVSCFRSSRGAVSTDAAECTHSLSLNVRLRLRLHGMWLSVLTRCHSMAEEGDSEMQ